MAMKKSGRLRASGATRGPSVLILALALVACDEEPSGPDAPDVEGFSIRRSGSQIYAYHPSDFSAADTFRVSAGDSIAVEFRWLDAEGETMLVSNSGADLTVTVTNQAVLRWRPHATDPFRGSFIGGALLQPVATAMQVELTIRGETVLDTPQLPVKTSP